VYSTCAVDHLSKCDRTIVRRRAVVAAAEMLEVIILFMMGKDLIGAGVIALHPTFFVPQASGTIAVTSGAASAWIQAVQRVIIFGTMTTEWMIELLLSVDSLSDYADLIESFRAVLNTIPNAIIANVKLEDRQSALSAVISFETILEQATHIVKANLDELQAQNDKPHTAATS